MRRIARSFWRDELSALKLVEDTLGVILRGFARLRADVRYSDAV
jgi:hypothetical protein